MPGTTRLRSTILVALTSSLLAGTPVAAADTEDQASVGWRFTALPGLSEADDPKGKADEMPRAVASGAHGMVAVGHLTCRSRKDCYARVWHSQDGETWTAALLQPGLRLGRAPGYGFGGVGLTSVTDGPAGFVAIGVARWRTAGREPRPVYGIWHSPDGMTWERLKEAPFGKTGHPRSIVATPERYIISGTEDTGRELTVEWPEGTETGGRTLQQRAIVWTSLDGRGWERTRLPGQGSGILGPATTDAGGGVVIPGAVCPPGRAGACYWATIWDRHVANDTRGAVWRSPDGRSWARELIDGWDGDPGTSEVGWGAPVAALGDRLVVPGGALVDGAFEPWDPPPGMIAPDEDRLPTSALLATVDEQVVMIGEATCGPTAWSSLDGIAWRPLPDLPIPDDLLRGPLRDLAAVGGDSFVATGWAEEDFSGFAVSASEAWLAGPPEPAGPAACTDAGPFVVRLSASDGSSITGVPAPACQATERDRSACHAQFPPLTDIPQLGVPVTEPRVRLSLADGSPFRATVVYTTGPKQYPRTSGYEVDRSLPAAACRAQTEQAIGLRSCARKAERTGRCELILLAYLDVGCPGGLGTYTLFRVIIEA